MTAKLQDQNIDVHAWYATLFGTYEANLNGSKDLPLSKFRQDGFEIFKNEAFPTRRDEDWKYTTVAPILQWKYKDSERQEFSKDGLKQFPFEEIEDIKLVFVNGYLHNDLSDIDQLPDGIHIISMKEALENEEIASWIENQNEYKGTTEKNPFVSMNQAFGSNGMVMIVDENVTIETPIHFQYINKAESQAHLTHPQLYVKANQGCEVTFIESHQSQETDSVYFSNVVTRIDVGANANVHHYKIQLESRGAYQINNALVVQERDSRYSSYAVDLGGLIIRNNISTKHKAPGIETNYYSAYLGNGRQHIDNQTFIDHAVPHCESNELYKGILDDKARGVFNGKVLVRQEAQKTNAFQQNNSLVLSNTAVMDSKPQLEIYADDVKCSHGATIGQLDLSSLFYLKSRGIRENQAKTLLQQAFLTEPLEKMKIASLREIVFDLIAKKLHV